MSRVARPSFSPAAVAARLWKDVPLGTPAPVVYKVRDDDISLRRPRGMDASDTSVFYDPRTITMRNPAVAGCVPGTPHGPSAFDASAHVPRPKVPYGVKPENFILTSLPVYPRTQPCICVSSRDIQMYSMAALVYSVPNALAVRRMAVEAGVLTLTDAIVRAAPDCVCSVFGDLDNLHHGLVAHASEFNDAPIIRMPNPKRLLLELNTRFVNEIVTTARTLHNDKLRLNYARVEGNRAYYQEAPAMVPFDPAPRAVDMSARTRRDPRASLANRQALSALIGIPLSSHAPGSF